MDETFDRIRSVRDTRWQYVRNFAPEFSHAQIISYMEIGRTMQVWREWYAAGKLNDAQRQFFAPTKPKEELYDTANDPFELKNLAGDPQHAAKLEELRVALDEWLKKTDDKGAIPVEQLVARGIITERAEKYAERVQRAAEAVKEELKK
jgi:hypothetical protein